MPTHCEERDIRIEQATLAAYGLETFLRAIHAAQRRDAMPPSPFFPREEKKDVEETSISYAAEALYCEDSGKHDVPLILARLWTGYLEEITGRAEMSKEGRANVMAAQIEALRMIEEHTLLLQKIFREWKPWDSPEWDEEEGDGIHRIEWIEER